MRLGVTDPHTAPDGDWASCACTLALVLTRLHCAARCGQARTPSRLETHTTPRLSTSRLRVMPSVSPPSALTAVQRPAANRAKPVDVAAQMVPSLSCPSPKTEPGRKPSR